MGLRGGAAVVIWGEMAGDAADVDLWYARWLFRRCCIDRRI